MRKKKRISEFTESQFRGFVGALVCLAGLLAYSNSFTNGFVWDDVSSVLRHADVQDPAKFLQLFREDQHRFGRSQGNFYRPLVSASFMLDYALSHGATPPEAPGQELPNLSPFLFHVTNTLWHLAAALLLFALLTRLEAPRLVRAVVPVVYVVHPLHTEAVTYISGRADPMCAAFMFAALWFAMVEGSEQKRTTGAALCGLCFVAALLCKESASIFPALLFLVIACRPVPAGAGERKQVYLRRMIPLAVSLGILAVYAGLRLTVLDFTPDEGTRAPTAALGQRLVETGQAFALYLRLVFVPTGLHMDRTLAGVPVWVGFLGYALLLACLLLVLYAVRRKAYRMALGMAWFLVTWFPVSGLFPLNAPMAEHWLYVPMAGLFWALAEWLWPVIQTRPAARRLAVAVVYGMCAWFAVVAVDRNRDWRDNETIYLATLEKNPRSLQAQYNLAVTYEVVLENMSGARRHYERSIELVRECKEPNPEGAEVFSDVELETHLALGKIYMDWQQHYRGAQHYGILVNLSRAERFRELIGTAAFGMGKYCLLYGDTELAAQYFNQALMGRPDLRPEIERLLPGAVSPSGPAPEDQPK